MTIKRIKNEKFGSKKMYKSVSGWALYEDGKGYIAFSQHRDKHGILIPYIPVGGKDALKSIIQDGGFLNMDGIEYVSAFN